jgi:protein ImuB
VTEHWWDPANRHRQARFQFVLDDGNAYLVVLERGRWTLAATYD